MIAEVVVALGSFYFEIPVEFDFFPKFPLGETDSSSGKPLPLVGEDSAAFDLGTQSIVSWVYFTVILFVLDGVWIDNSTGFGKAFIDAVSTLSDNHGIVMLALILIFAMGDKFLGKRVYRVLFAGVPLPLAVSTVVYYINHRYDGVQLWQLQDAPGVHQLMVGQVNWCLPHTIWIGNSVAVAASIGLIGQHLFGIWNADRRLAVRHREAFQSVKKRTSIIPQLVSGSIGSADSFIVFKDGRNKTHTSRSW
ncbi:hypothetical protein V6N13_110115 [Hibiscus sabdariffa]